MILHASLITHHLPLYKLSLILKYLTKRRIAWVSLIAVMLCTAMVIVVISVMGGWLRMFKESFHGLTGDVIVHGDSLAGFPYYQEMADKIEKLPNVTAAVPTLETFALINVKNVSRRGVQVQGIPIDRIGLVNQFPESLYRQHQHWLEMSNDPKLTPEERAEAKARAERGLKAPSFDKPYPAEMYKDLVATTAKDPDKWPGMIVGGGVVGIRRDENGDEPSREGVWQAWVRMTVMGVSGDSSAVDPIGNKSERLYWIVDDSHSKVWQIDDSTVYVPFDVLQKDLGMSAHDDVDPDTNQKTPVPARTHDLQVAVVKGANLKAVKVDVQRVVDEVSAEHRIEAYYPVLVETWEESKAQFIQAIEKEKGLVTFLFSLISIVAVFLIFCIFYMIVVEKTRDIGIIKSCGATSISVASIFLGYGLAIGVVGAGLGLLAGWLVIHNINFLHHQMSLRLGIVIWDPRVYAFDTIPSTINPREVAVILLVAVLSALLGALIPSIRAARMNPVEALRWE